jgi:hypothetical protein
MLLYINWDGFSRPCYKWPGTAGPRKRRNLDRMIARGAYLAKSCMRIAGHHQSYAANVGIWRMAG